MWYNVDWNKLSEERDPSFLRRPIFLTFIQTVVSLVDDIHYQWKLKREEDWYKLNHTGQVCKLRKVLNDKLDLTERRIYITDGNSFPRKYIYTRAENKPAYLGRRTEDKKMYIYQRSEYENTGVDFIVFVPQTIYDTKINELNALIKFYKLAGKRYQIRPIYESI